MLASYNYDSNLDVWSLSDGKKIASTKAPPDPSYHFRRNEFVWLADSQHIVVTRPNSNGCAIFDVTTQKKESIKWRGLPSRDPLAFEKGATDDLKNVNFAPSGEFLIGTLGKQVAVVFVDLKSKWAIGTWPTPNPITALRVSPDSTKVAVGTADGRVQVIPVTLMREALEKAESVSLADGAASKPTASQANGIETTPAKKRPPARKRRQQRSSVPARTPTLPTQPFSAQE
jgi:WD40 repeat protein